MSKEELVKFCTFNCRRLGQNSNCRIVFQWLKKYHKGIILLQERHTTEIIENYWHNELKGQIEFCHGLSSARGVAILISNNINITINEVIRYNTGSFLLLDKIFEGQNLILVNIHGPTKGTR